MRFLHNLLTYKVRNPLSFLRSLLELYKLRVRMKCELSQSGKNSRNMYSGCVGIEPRPGDCVN